MSAAFYFGTNRRQGIDNFNRLMVDAYTGMVWEDNAQILSFSSERSTTSRTGGSYC